MIQGPNTTQLLAAIPEAKLEEKRGRTKTGTVLVLIGLVLVAIAFVLAMRIVDGQTEITLTVLALLGAPLLAGVLLCLVGATVWSGELVTAGFKDILGTVRGLAGAFRKNGGAA